jgi:hypothetical protein
MADDDRDLVARQLGREPRAFAAVAARCPFGRPAAIRQRSYLDSGEPFPTTFYLTCPAAVAAVGRLEDAGGVARYQRLVAEDRHAGESAPRMLDGGASLALGIGGTARDGAVKCLHAHAAFALGVPGYRLGARILAEAAPLYPDQCCTP